MIRLVYTSTAVEDLSPDQLLQILKSCRKNNSANDVTGILLYAHRTFFQVLEGKKEIILNLFEIIKKDPRHENVTLLETKEIFEREFPYWNMGFQKLNKEDFHNLEGFDNFSEDDFSAAGFLAHKSVISPLIKLIRGRLVEQVEVTVHEELPVSHEDPFIRTLNHVIRGAVKFLAVLMVFVIILGVIEVIYVIYEKVSSPPYFLISINDLLATFGAFLAVLIAIEIFLNITLYIRSDVIPVKLVVATALMAISRKVIVFDFNKLEPEYIASTSLVVIALGITYWVIDIKERTKSRDDFINKGEKLK